MDSWPTFHDLMYAYRKCRLHKSANQTQVEFEMKLGKSLVDLHRQLASGCYYPEQMHCFVVTHPKPREIFAASFRDRIVHHLVVGRLEPIWEKKFIDASFACRTGKGVHGAIRHFQKKGRQLSQGGIKPVFALQLDIEKFFVSIDRPTLSTLMAKYAKESNLKNLARTLFEHDSRKGVRRIGQLANFSLIPAEKSWFSQSPNQGIPIGNLTSQFGANVYLTGLDHFIQRQLKPAAYLRYMDDLVLLETQKDRLQGLPKLIDQWLRLYRGQKLNAGKTCLTGLCEGISYLGYKLRQTNVPAEPLEIFVEPKKKWNLVTSLRELENRSRPTVYRPHQLAPWLSEPQAKTMLASINSRIGNLSHARSYELRKIALEAFVRNTTDCVPDSWSPYVIKKRVPGLKTPVTLLVPSPSGRRLENHPRSFGLSW